MSTIYSKDISELYVPKYFPVEGNEKTLELLNPAFKYLILIDKIIVCSAINSLTLNIKPINNGHDYNSNFIVMPKGFGKTTLLKEIFQKSNPKKMLITESKHFESEMFGRNEDDFLGKTWLNFDAISLFMTSKPVQRAQLIAFYTETLSDGLYSRKSSTIEADYNLQYVMASEKFYELQKELYDSTLFDRIVPIYYHPSDEDKELIMQKANINRTEYQTNRMPTIELPYIKDLSDISHKFGFEYGQDISDKIYELSQIMTEQTQMGITRVSRYISNFICSNAHINGRARNYKVFPNHSDIELFEWLLDIHFPLDKNSFEFAVYSAIKDDEQLACTVSDIINSDAVLAHELVSNLTNNDKDRQTFTNNVRMVLNRLVTRGMLLTERTGGLPIYWCNE